MTIHTLLIEDDPGLANLALLRLETLKMDVFHASDGLQAMDYLEANRPDLILLDINIPLVDGWDVLDFARAKHPDIHVIVTTARKDLVSRAKGEIEKVDRYLVKPFSARELLTAINEVMGDGTMSEATLPQADDAETASSTLPTATDAPIGASSTVPADTFKESGGVSNGADDPADET
ncbi:MAG: response regulator transcription factor [Chloroflexota bacterium]